ncbi:hypothetical protein Tco_0415302 [Tanacetum coccineum]
MHEGDETVEVFRIETDIFLFETPLCKEFKEFNHLLHIDVDVLTQDLPGFKTYEDYKNTCGHVEWPTCNWRDDGYYNEVDLPRVIREESFGNYHELDYELMLKLEEYWWGKKEEEESSEDAWSNYSPNDENKIIKMMPFKRIKNGFEYHEIMVDDDDIGGLDDYLIPKDEPYHVDEEGEGFKERKSKLLGIPYKKPPTFKSEKFEVIKYSFGPAEEYVAIKEYEYDIWVKTEENVSHVYQEIFHKRDEGWFMTKTT